MKSLLSVVMMAVCASLAFAAEPVPAPQPDLSSRIASLEKQNAQIQSDISSIKSDIAEIKAKLTGTVQVDTTRATMLMSSGTGSCSSGSCGSSSMMMTSSSGMGGCSSGSCGSSSARRGLFGGFGIGGRRR